MLIVTKAIVNCVEQPLDLAILWWPIMLLVMVIVKLSLLLCQWVILRWWKQEVVLVAQWGLIFQDGELAVLHLHLSSAWEPHDPCGVLLL